MPVPAYNTSPSLLLSTTNLNGIELGANETVRFGAGLQWGTVYDFLEPHGLVVPGGRARPVGVAGFLLHGGVSHFYAEVGWACESVVEFEVALADGRVVLASSQQNEDLYWALKGGGKNFGVVTAFRMKTRRLPRMWGGVRVALGKEDVARRVFEGLHGLHDGGEESEKAHVEVISFYNPMACVGGDPLFALALAYAGEVERPEVLRGFWEVEAVADMTRVTTQRDLGDDEKNFVGYDKRCVVCVRFTVFEQRADDNRGLFRTFSYRGSPELTLEIYKEYYEAVKKSGMHDLDPTAIAGLLWSPSAKRLASGTSVLSLGEEAEAYVCKWSPMISTDSTTVLTSHPRGQRSLPLGEARSLEENARHRRWCYRDSQEQASRRWRICTIHICERCRR